MTLKSVKGVVSPVVGNNFFSLPYWGFVLIVLQDKEYSKTEIFKEIYNKFNTGSYAYTFKVVDTLVKYKILVEKDKKYKYTDNGKNIADKMTALYFGVCNNVKFK